MRHFVVASALFGIFGTTSALACSLAAPHMVESYPEDGAVDVAPSATLAARIVSGEGEFEVHLENAAGEVVETVELASDSSQEDAIPAIQSSVHRLQPVEPLVTGQTYALVGTAFAGDLSEPSVQRTTFVVGNEPGAVELEAAEFSLNLGAIVEGIPNDSCGQTEDQQEIEVSIPAGTQARLVQIVNGDGLRATRIQAAGEAEALTILEDVGELPCYTLQTFTLDGAQSVESAEQCVTEDEVEAAGCNQAGPISGLGTLGALGVFLRRRKSTMWV